MTVTQTFNFTGGWQTFTVPSGVTSLFAVLNGAGSSGQRGGKCEGAFAVTAGQIIYIACGEAGNAGGTGSSGTQAGGGTAFGHGGAGGAGLNGHGGTGGGGCSEIRIGSTTGVVKAVAGGAGGDSGDGVAGGPGGGTTGGHGGNGDASGSFHYGGAGGTNSAGGIGGTSPRTGIGGGAGASTAPGLGGTGGDTNGFNGVGGGGGGGGYKAGGGGTGSSTGFQTGGGGGGGASYVTPLSSPISSQGTGSTGNGSVTIQYNDPNAPPATPTSVTPTSGTFTKSTGTVTMTARLTDPDGDTVRAIFRLSTGTSFASGTYTDHISALVSSGSTASLAITGLSQNTHYYARVYAQDVNTILSAAFASTDFWTNRPPNNPVALFPLNGASSPASSDQTFTWSFSDPDPSDVQGGATFFYRKVGDTDFATIAVTGATGACVVPANTFLPSTSYEWKVQVKDVGGLLSPGYSDLRTFAASGDTGVPVNVAPAQSAVLDSTVDNDFDWNFIDPDVSKTQQAFQFRYAANGDVGWTEESVVTSTDSTLTAVANTFDAGVQYAWGVRTQNSDGDWSPYSSGIFYTLEVLPTPTMTLPVNGSIVATAVPALGSSRTAPVPWQSVKAEWQLATDAGFTTGVKNFVQDNSKLTLTTTSSDVLPGVDAVDQSHLWYIRTRDHDTFGNTSGWSAAFTFRSQHPPNAVNLNPGANAYVPRTTGTRFSWAFQDSSPSAHQSAYQVIIETTGGTGIVDTGKVSSTNQFALINIITAPLDSPLRWKVSLWDDENVQGPFSGYQVFTCGEPPSFTITPENDSTVETGAPTVAWADLVLSGSRIQTEWDISFFDSVSGVLVHEMTGNLSSQRDYTPSQTILLNARQYIVSVTITDSAGLPATVVSFFQTAFDTPDILSYRIDISQIDSAGYVNIDWAGSVVDEAMAGFRVYRRLASDVSWTLLAEINNQSVTDYHDWLFHSGSMYLYTVTQVADRFGSLVESPIGFNATYVPGRQNLVTNPNGVVDTSTWDDDFSSGNDFGAPERKFDGGPINNSYIRATWGA